MKFWSSHLRQDKLELKYAHGKTARKIKGTAVYKQLLNNLGLIRLGNTQLRVSKHPKG